MPLRIAFSGKAKSGKDVCCNYLAQKFTGVHLKFADKLYKLTRMCQQFMNFPIEKDRKLLHFLGTEWGRSQNPEVWVNLLRDEIYKYSPDENIFISDLRFVNEKDMLENEDFITIRIERDECENLELSSETELDNYLITPFHYYINNNGSKEDLFQYLNEIIEDILSV